MRYLLVVFLAILLIGCKAQTIYVPVKETEIEYRDKILKDSVFLHDSIFVLMKGDTVYFEKYKTIYKESLRIDSVLITDSIQVPYPVVEYKEVNRLSSIQSFQIWCGRIILFLLLAYFGVRGIRRLF